MSRLIDADECEVVSWKATGNKDYDAGFDDGAVFVIKKIDDAPIIDAIPVEWLNETRKESTDAQWHYSVATVLYRWQKEKGGR